MVYSSTVPGTLGMVLRNVEMTPVRYMSMSYVDHIVQEKYPNYKVDASVHYLSFVAANKIERFRDIKPLAIYVVLDNDGEDTLYGGVVDWFIAREVDGKVFCESIIIPVSAEDFIMGRSPQVHRYALRPLDLEITYVI